MLTLEALAQIPAQRGTTIADPILKGGRGNDSHRCSIRLQVLLFPLHTGRPGHLATNLTLPLRSITSHCCVVLLNSTLLALVISSLPISCSGQGFGPEAVNGSFWGERDVDVHGFNLLMVACCWVANGLLDLPLFPPALWR